MTSHSEVISLVVMGSNVVHGNMQGWFDIKYVYISKSAIQTHSDSGIAKRCILVHPPPPQTNKPPTESETHETKTWQFSCKEIIIKVPKYTEILQKCGNFLKIRVCFYCFTFSFIYVYWSGFPHPWKSLNKIASFSRPWSPWIWPKLNKILEKSLNLLMLNFCICII